MAVVFGEKWLFAAPVLGLLAVSKGIMSPWGEFGVSSISGGFNEAGPLNGELEIAAGDLLAA